MVSISFESVEDTRKRLRSVIRSSAVRFYEEPYAFLESPIENDPVVAPGALALVRDDEVWSCFLPARTEDAERFAIWRFHFPDGVDNSGFVGWLATELKRKLGTGVIVICGQNSRHGGIFDYWGCPWDLRDQARTELVRLIS